MKRFTFAFSMLLALLTFAAEGSADVPQTISYQGVLADGAGNMVSDGPYSFTFKIYNVAVAGAALWTEVQPAVPVVRGGFSVILGSVTPITLPFDTQYWLGISVGGGAELAPRVQLASSPYGLSLRLPFSGSASSGGPALSIKNTGAGPDIVVDHQLNIGSATTDGTADWYRSGFREASVFPFGPVGYWLYVGGDTYGGKGIAAIGNANSVGDPDLFMIGNTNILSLDLTQTGDATVQLPTDAIDSGEIIDEPGIAQSKAGGTTVGTSMTDFTSVTVTTPADGYIFLTANGTHYISGDALGNNNFAYIQISEASAGALDAPHSVILGTYNGSPTPPVQWYAAAAVTRTYFKPAGTYTFYFQGIAINPAHSLNNIYEATLTAMYFPTSRGTVTTVVNGAERAQFSHAQPLVVQGNGPIPASSDGALVDLRELEQRAAQQRAELAKTQADIARARFAEGARARGSAGVRKP